MRCILKTRNIDKLCVSILTCSDDIHYLENLDQHVKRLDVSDDYATESTKTRRTGLINKFTRGDYIAKVLLGPGLPNWNKIDGKQGR